MIELITASAPSGWKASIALDERGLGARSVCAMGGRSIVQK